MAQPHVIGALSNKRAELADVVRQLEQKPVQYRTNMAHLDATMRLFDADIQPNQSHPKRQRARNGWFRPGECLRLIYDQLRDATQPMTTRELAARIMQVKAISATDKDNRERMQKTILGSLNRTKQMIAGVVRRRVTRGGGLTPPGQMTAPSFVGVAGHGSNRWRGGEPARQ